MTIFPRCPGSAYLLGEKEHLGWLIMPRQKSSEEAISDRSNA